MVTVYAAVLLLGNHHCLPVCIPHDCYCATTVRRCSRESARFSRPGGKKERKREKKKSKRSRLRAASHDLPISAGGYYLIVPRSSSRPHQAVQYLGGCVAGFSKDQTRILIEQVDRSGALRSTDLLPFGVKV